MSLSAPAFQHKFPTLVHFKHLRLSATTFPHILPSVFLDPFYNFSFPAENQGWDITNTALHVRILINEDVKKTLCSGSLSYIRRQDALEDDETFQNMIPFGFIGQDSADRRQEGGERAKGK